MERALYVDGTNAFYPHALDGIARPVKVSGVLQSNLRNQRSILNIVLCIISFIKLCKQMKTLVRNQTSHVRPKPKKTTP